MHFDYYAGQLRLPRTDLEDIQNHPMAELKEIRSKKTPNLCQEGLILPREASSKVMESLPVSSIILNDFIIERQILWVVMYWTMILPHFQC